MCCHKNIRKWTFSAFALSLNNTVEGHRCRHLSPAHEPDHLPPREPMKWSWANWNYSNAYTVLLGKPGLLKQKLLHATNSYFVLALKKTLPYSSILNANIICTSNKLEQYSISQYFCEILWPLYYKFFFPWALYFYSHLHALRSPVEFFINSSNITIYCKVFTLHSMSSDLYFVDWAAYATFQMYFLIIALNHGYLGKLITYASII